MKNLPRRLFLYFALALPLLVPRAAEAEKKPAHVLTVDTDRSDALYRRGETITFRIRLEHEGKPIESGEIAWVLSKDGVEPRQTGRASLKDGVATVSGKLDEPGFLQCSATYQVG